MEENKYISKSKTTRMLIGMALVCLISGVLIAATMQKRSQHLSKISFVNSTGIQSFLSEETLNQILSKAFAGDLKNIPISKLNIENIEATLQASPWIQNAEVYIDNKRQMKVEITERKPVARIFANDGKSYLLDSAAALMPAELTLPKLIPVFTNMPYLGKDEMSRKIGSAIAYLGSIITADSFWNAQITQIEVLPNGQFEMATLLGKHKVIFGDTTFAKEKFNNLFVFYSKGLTKLGWNRYEKVDVRYKGQVVASPGMDYTAPIVSDTVIDMPDNDDATINAKTIVTPSPTTVAPQPAPSASKTDNKPKIQNNTPKIAQPKPTQKPKSSTKPSPPKKEKVKNQNKNEATKKSGTSSNIKTDNTKNTNKPKTKYLLSEKNKQL